MAQIYSGFYIRSHSRSLLKHLCTTSQHVYHLVQQVHHELSIVLVVIVVVTSFTSNLVKRLIIVHNRYIPKDSQMSSSPLDVDLLFFSIEINQSVRLYRAN